MHHNTRSVHNKLPPPPGLVKDLATQSLRRRNQLKLLVTIQELFRRSCELMMANTTLIEVTRTPCCAVMCADSVQQADVATRPKPAPTISSILLNFMCSAHKWNSCTLQSQALKAGGYDAVLSFSMPGSSSDNCGCVVAHALGAPLVAVHGSPFLLGPLTVPQVRGRQGGTRDRLA